jgi:hypothetical protein
MAVISSQETGTWPVCKCVLDKDYSCGGTGCPGGANIIRCGPTNPVKKKAKPHKDPGHIAPPWVRNSRKKR